jgi:DNA repair protein RadC
MSETRAAQRRATGRKDVAEWLQLSAELTRMWLRDRALSGPILSTTRQIIDYLRAEHAFTPRERTRVLFLNSRNRLLRDEVIIEGTLDEAPFWPREILRRGLEVHAAGMLVVHNHPSGDQEPSSQDLEITREFVYAAKVLKMDVHDHLVISSAGYSSMREKGLL